MSKKNKYSGDFHARLKGLKGMVDVQSADGNWDYDDYMYGLANGLILAYNIMRDRRDADIELLSKIKKKKKKRK